MDATARVFTTETVLVSMWAEIIPNRQSLRSEMQAKIIGENLVQDPVLHFENAVEDFLHVKATTRLLFYLVEYWMWFKEYTKSFKCFELSVEFSQPVIKQRVYILEVDEEYTILVVLIATARTNENDDA